MDLYGFYSKEELELFEMLISVSGVGAKGAVSILSVTTPNKLSASIATGDSKTITKAQGIGSKTAQRICLELKDKIKNESLYTTGENEVIEDNSMLDSKSEAISALMVLGYPKAQAQKAVLRVPSSVVDVETIVKEALKNLI